MDLLNRIKKHVYLFLALGLTGCPYTNNSTVEISNRTLDEKIEEHCFQEFENLGGQKLSEPTECFLDAIAEAIGEDMPDKAYLTFVPEGATDWNKDNLGLNTEVGDVVYVAIEEDFLSHIFETTFHEFGHSLKPGDSAYGNHLNAEFFTTYFAFNLIKVMANSDNVWNYHSPNLPFFSLCPLKITPYDIDEDRTWLYSDAVCNTGLSAGAYRYNKDFIPAEVVLNQMMDDYNGDLETMRAVVEEMSYYQEYKKLIRNYEDDCNPEELDKEFYADFVDARNALTWYVNNEMPELSDFWSEYETSYSLPEE